MAFSRPLPIANGRFSRDPSNRKRHLWERQRRPSNRKRWLESPPFSARLVRTQPGVRTLPADGSTPGREALWMAFDRRLRADLRPSTRRFGLPGRLDSRASESRHVSQRQWLQAHAIPFYLRLKRNTRIPNAWNAPQRAEVPFQSPKPGRTCHLAGRRPVWGSPSLRLAADRRQLSRRRQFRCAPARSLYRLLAPVDDRNLARRVKIQGV